MQTDWKIKKSEYRDHKTERILDEGESFYACLYDEVTEDGESLVRRDFALDTWPGENDPGCFSYWKSKVPFRKEKRQVVDLDLLDNLFHRLFEEKDEKKQAFCFLISLMLMRKRVLKFEDSFQQGDRNMLLLRHVREKRNYTIVDPKLNEEQIEDVRGELESLFQSDLE